MNIGYALSSVSRANGGISESVRRLVQSVYTQKDVNVTAFGLEDAHTREDAPQWKPVPVRTFPVRGPRAIGYAPALDRALADAHLDVLHTAGLWMYPSVAARRWAKKSARPYAVSPHGMLDPWALSNSGWKKKIAERAYERAHLEGAACIHALCESEANSIRAFGLRNPVCVLPNGVDLPDLSRTPKPPPWASLVPADAPVMLFLGRLHPKKGLLPLLRAWSAVRDSDWRLAIAGWDQGGHRAELEALVRDAGLEKYVFFLGPLHGEQKEAAYRASSAFVLSSFSEGLPMTVLEAWAYGLPVLMTSACNLPEGFSAGAAIEVQAEVAPLAESLRSFVALPTDARKAMGERARILAGSRFDWAQIADQMVAVYRWISGSGAKPACVWEKN